MSVTMALCSRLQRNSIPFRKCHARRSNMRVSDIICGSALLHDPAREVTNQVRLAQIHFPALWHGTLAPILLSKSTYFARRPFYDASATCVANLSC
ncbi:hypothetical protein DAI22_10g176400 [Oryza sativa Japonica Group]|nr:hypothetical protein DAI22_10g176400 [Oryza sativa Japonica Group]